MGSTGLRAALAAAILLGCWTSTSAEVGGRKKIVLIAGKKSHGPEGNGIHDYPWSVKLLKVMLDNSNIRDQVAVEYHRDGWPADPKTLDTADAIMVISDGRDGDLYEEAPHIVSPEHIAQVQQQIARGCGFLTFHFSTFAPDERAKEMLDWTGGYFDWETDGKKQWYSAIQTLDTEVELASPDHPVLRGVKPLKMKEEFYYNLRFDPQAAPVAPLWTVPAIPGRDAEGRVVAWARQRANGGRGFGTTCGHFYDNWKLDSFRKLILNAIAWNAHVEVPPEGVAARFYTHAEITAALTGVAGVDPARFDDRPIKALILTGHHYPGHLWKDTTPAIREALARDLRVQVEVSENIEDLATDRVQQFDVLIQNYCNWERPGLSDAAKAGFVKYLQEGGGLCIVHFANGAFHFSLPKAEDSDWPEYRNICRRVWDHTDKKVGHDAYGKFVVDIADPEHPVMQGMEAFETIDELYFRQQGEDPIHVLATAKSKVTGQAEPQAFVYDYGKGRIFQTVLGHAAESLRTPGAATLLSRAVAWAARREPLTTMAMVPPPAAAPPAGPAGKLSLGEGKFGKSLDARSGGAHAGGREEYHQPPLTVDCWAKLLSKQSYNILAAQELKSSATHWELFTMPGSGQLTAYLPGYKPDHVRSQVDVADGKWHHVGMVFEPARVRLFVDGQQVADQAVEFQKGQTVAGGIAFGQLVGREIGCDGFVDEARLTRGVRDLSVVPDKAPAVDPRTLGLWRFDELSPDGKTRDETPVQNAASAAVAAAAPAPSAPQQAARGPIEGHFAEGTVGFNWTEGDSVDNRWSQTDVGPFLASTIFLPNLPPVQKGLSIRVGDQQQGTLCYDTERGTLRAGWTGGFLQFGPARYGLIESPRFKGELNFAWQPLAAGAKYRGLLQHGSRSVLQFDVAGTAVREAPWAVTVDTTTVFQRTFEVEPHRGVVIYPLAQGTNDAKVAEADGWQICSSGDLHCGIRKSDSCLLRTADSGRVELFFRPGDQPVSLVAYQWKGTADPAAVLARLPNGADNITPWKQPAAPLWPQILETRGELATDDGPYVVDTLTIPFENPWKALIFTSGHDFFSNGDIAVCTAHGDVWRVSGVDAGLQRLTWKRYATGLFQPLGLKVVGDLVHVLGRDQITRLHDRNGDGEADWYECFHNAGETSPGGHDYVTCLETDLQGRFYYAHAKQGVLRTGPDGQGLEVIATGFRNPNGLGVGPDGTITAAPQEGEWTPSSNIIEVQPGGYYGYPGPQVTADRPLGYDLPICWIPRRNDNSSGGQCWVTSDRWGPLQNQLLHFSFGQCSMLLTLREKVDGVTQGGTVTFPFTFSSGAMRGRFSPHDGQLYVTGQKGWVTSAVQDGCLQRVRYTGQPVGMPTAVKTYRNGLALTFTEPLDRNLAEDPDRYAIEQWNYRYAADYGSAEYRPSDPRQEGRDELPVRSATLLDPKTVFLELPGLQPVNQLSLSYRIKLADGTSVRQQLNSTIHKLSETAIPQDQLTVRARPGVLPDEVMARLRPGIAMTESYTAKELSLGVFRMAAWDKFYLVGDKIGTDAGVPCFLKAPFSGEYRFLIPDSFEELVISGVAAGSGEPVDLHRGFNSIRFRSSTTQRQTASKGRRESSGTRLLWSGEDFDWEPIPPTALWHAPGHNDRNLPTPETVQSILEQRRCTICHDLKESTDYAQPGPSLAGLGSRRRADWVAAWILAPRTLRPTAKMPHFFNPDKQTDRQTASDIAAYLASLKIDEPESATGDAKRGVILYEDLGCIACHRFTAPEKEDDFQRLSLTHVSASFSEHALQAYLLNPQTHYTLNPMPRFPLSSAEAADLVAYLRAESEGKFIALNLPAGDVERGKQAFFGATRNCFGCHSTIADRPPLPVAMAKFKDFTRGCLAPTAELRGDAPDFGLTEWERTAVSESVPPESLGALFATVVANPSLGSRRLVRELNCRACHSRDGQRSPRAEILADESDRGVVAEVLPDLTWAGEKLRPEWTARLLNGELAERTRPWLKARMPAFPADYAARLAVGLAVEHGAGRDIQQPKPPKPDLVELGRRLTLKDGGLDCRQCHGIGQLKPQGDSRTQIAPGINFAQVRERLQPEFYHRFVLDPPRYELATRMPKLAADGKTTKATAILDGDAKKQFEALWHYIQTVTPETAE
ncbi:ThuA domain-containing protein [Planctellipticum variicoloris]|uniref:ThuA domain-containing protein n=1 Tax=Planctellipticum variicoloris TaxID=3064265 RepID=UPI00301362CE|nr:ThuA domain-containing protein [Planctomycetaceae bacterium SH412]